MSELSRSISYTPIEPRWSTILRMTGRNYDNELVEWVYLRVDILKETHPLAQASNKLFEEEPFQIWLRVDSRQRSLLVHPLQEVGEVG